MREYNWCGDHSDGPRLDDPPFNCEAAAEAIAAAVLAALISVGVALLQRSIAWACYDLQNCYGCRGTIDWSEERGRSSLCVARLWR